MKTKTFMLLSTALFTLGLGPALAGPCTTEIESLTKALSAKDAGSGPSSGASGAARSPAGEHPPTAAMGQQTEGKAISPEDVRRQTQGQPTAGEATGRSAAAPAAMDKANEELARARGFDQQGKEADCMASVRQAKQLSGTK